jgi:hypothetical protein
MEMGNGVFSCQIIFLLLMDFLNYRSMMCFCGTPAWCFIFYSSADFQEETERYSFFVFSTTSTTQLIKLRVFAIN